MYRNVYNLKKYDKTVHFEDRSRNRDKSPYSGKSDYKGRNNYREKVLIPIGITTISSEKAVKIDTITINTEITAEK